MVNPSLNSKQVKLLATKEEAGSDKQIRLGKKLFFEETFGNEVFFTDVMGLFNGPFTLGNLTKAVLKLHGKGTSNLKVEAAQSFHSGHVTIRKGDIIETGLDVAKGSYIPIGIKVVYEKGRPRAGISCAACHATVDNTGNVIAGTPNKDLNIGLILSMATNTASFFTHTEIKNIKDFIKEIDSPNTISLPDKSSLEKFTDSEIIKWPPGSNDTTIDFKNNPVQIPDAFTLGDYPYGWSGQGQIGPFKGLSAAINNAHAQNMDSLSQFEISEPVLNIDKEVYLGTILQNAANKKYQYNIKMNLKPSQFFAKIDPTPHVPGVSKLIQSATYPKISFLSSVGLLPSSNGYKAWEQINAISAYLNSLTIPQTNEKENSVLFGEGKMAFRKAGCISCHSGEYLTNNRVVKVEQIKTDPSRAAAFKKTELFFSKPKMYSSNTPVPLPKKPDTIELKLTPKEIKSLNMSWAHGNSKGGYKVPSLYGLQYSAPYLHDGGVSVGKNMELGISNTLMKGIKADPYNSLLALVDSNLRNQVIKSNLSSKVIRSEHISGKGHNFWVDESSGFTIAEQKALIYYLLHIPNK
jgi:hypothetical protein